MNVYKEEYETLYPSRCGSVSRNVFYSKGTLFLIVSTPYKQTWKNISSRLEFFISIMGVFDTVDYETLPRGASSFFSCFRHIQWSESVLTQCFNATRFVLGASLLFKISKVCMSQRKSPSCLKLYKSHIVIIEVKRGKNPSCGPLGLQAGRPPTLDNLQPVSPNLEGRTPANQTGLYISEKTTTCSCMIYHNDRAKTTSLSITHYDVHNHCGSI